MALVASGNYQESSDGGTVLLNDTSNYGVDGNPPASNWERTWVVRNSVGTILYTLPIPNEDLQVEFPNIVDKYYEATLSFVGSPAVADLVIDFGTSQIEANMIDDILANNCGGICKSSTDKKLRYGFIYFNRAERRIRYTNAGTTFNNFITASNKWLST